MNIAHILNQVRKKRVNYSKMNSFTIPIKWQREPNITFALIPKEHAAMIAAASGKSLAHYAIYIPNRDDFLGIGDNSVSLYKNGKNDNYVMRHERRDFKNPLVLPESIDLSQKLKPPEAPDTRPTEMTPEDYYM